MSVVELQVLQSKDETIAKLKEEKEAMTADKVKWDEEKASLTEEKVRALTSWPARWQCWNICMVSLAELRSCQS